MFKEIIFYFLFLLLFSPFCQAQVETPDLHDGSWISFAPKIEPQKPRGFVLPQIVSFILPGFDQWWEHQYAAASLYSGYALSGLLISSDASSKSSLGDINDLSSRNPRLREYQLGEQMTTDAGFISAYHSFRTAVRTQQPEGKFLFLTKEEGLDDVYSAPFAFSEIKKPSTYVALAIALTLGILDIADYSGSPRLNAGDGIYSGVFSYGAGTAEEAFFRGWILPVSYQYMQSPFWSNATTSVLFAAAHLSSDNRLPLPQLVLGYYLGYLTQKNGWTLRQSIFIHTWWDVISFASSYYASSRQQNSAAFMIPLLSASF